MKRIKRWMRFSALSSTLVLVPALDALAFAPQWRPTGEMAPVARSAVSAGRHDARFRPVTEKTDHTLSAERVRAPAQPVTAMAQGNVPAMPAFVRQYQWRPAAQPWAASPYQPADYPADRMAQASPYGYSPYAQWQPVAHFVPPRPAAPLPPVPPVAPLQPPMPGSWRPVEQMHQQPVQYAASGYAYPQVAAPAAMPTVPALYPMQPGYAAMAPQMPFVHNPMMPPHMMHAPVFPYAPPPPPMPWPMMPAMAGAPMWMPPPAQMAPYGGGQPGWLTSVPVDQPYIAGTCPECSI